MYIVSAVSLQHTHACFDPPSWRNPSNMSLWQSKQLTKWKSPMSVWGRGHRNNLAGDTVVSILLGALWILHVVLVTDKQKRKTCLEKIVSPWQCWDCINLWARQISHKTHLCAVPDSENRGWIVNFTRYELIQIAEGEFKMFPLLLFCPLRYHHTWLGFWRLSPLHAAASHFAGGAAAARVPPF